MAEVQRHLFDEANRGKKLMDEAFGGESLRAMAKLHEGAAGLSRMVEETRRHQNVLDELRKGEAFQNISRPADLLKDISPSLFVQPPLRDGIREVTDRINEAADRRDEQRQAEREEEIEINRSIREMTMKSAELLAQLTQASTNMLEKFGVFLADFKESAKRNDAGARKSLMWAAGSLVVTAVLTLVAGVIALQSYRQDKAAIASDDRWQAEVTEILKSQGTGAEKARQDLAIENGQLRQRIETLEKAASAKAEPPAQKGEKVR